MKLNRLLIEKGAGVCCVSGHDFRRAVTWQKIRALAPVLLLLLHHPHRG